MWTKWGAGANERTRGGCGDRVKALTIQGTKFGTENYWHRSWAPHPETWNAIPSLGCGEASDWSGSKDGWKSEGPGNH